MQPRSQLFGCQRSLLFALACFDILTNTAVLCYLSFADIPSGIFGQDVGNEAYDEYSEILHISISCLRGWFAVSLICATCGAYAILYELIPILRIHTLHALFSSILMTLGFFSTLLILSVTPVALRIQDFLCFRSSRKFYVSHESCEDNIGFVVFVGLIIFSTLVIVRVAIVSVLLNFYWDQVFKSNLGLIHLRPKEETPLYNRRFRSQSSPSARSQNIYRENALGLMTSPYVVSPKMSEELAFFSAPDAMTGITNSTAESSSCFRSPRPPSQRRMTHAYHNSAESFTVPLYAPLAIAKLSAQQFLIDEKEGLPLV